jgi:hypothetical protein
MTKRFRISMQLSELYEVVAETEEEAYEMIALGQVEPIDKEYWGDDNVWEVNDDSDQKI